MGKNIVLLLDGTGNGITERRTNILRLYGTLVKSEDQLVWYDPGVGSFGGDDPLRLVPPNWRETVQQGTGAGMHQNVREAYRFLVETYQPGDRIHLQGFSRGAYSARVLAGFLYAFGLMEPRNLNLLDYVYRAYRSVDESPDLRDAREHRDREGPLAAINLHRRALRPREVEVASMGLFDTVASMIERKGWVRYGVRLHAFTHENPGVRKLRHAMAIDERRVMFRPRLWGSQGMRDLELSARTWRDVKEEWFAGVHRDVGGGRDSEEDSQLGKVPLAWMIDELRHEDLIFDDALVQLLVQGEGPGAVRDGERIYYAPNATRRLDLSKLGGLEWMEWVPFLRTGKGIGGGAPGRKLLGLPLPGGARREIPEDAVIHPSVFERMAAGLGYDPQNLPKPAREAYRSWKAARDAAPAG